MSAANVVLHIEIPLSWKIVLVKGQLFAWHRKPRLNVQQRDVIAGPQVYRWVLKDKTHKITAVYIGETERFEVRLKSYCITNATAPTKTKRIRQELKRCEDEGGSVELQFLDLESGQFTMNGTFINRFSLPQHSARILMESIAVFLAEAEGYIVLNHSRPNVIKKDIVKIFNKSSDKRKLLDSVLHSMKKNDQSS